MLGLGARLRDLMLIHKISKEELAERCDLPIETIRNIYYGKTIDPKVSTVMKMAKVFNVSVNCLMGQCQHTVEEKLLLRYYRTCGEHGKAIIDIVAKYEALSAKAYREEVGAYTIPCIVPHCEPSQGILYDTNENVEIVTSVKNAHIAIKIITNDLIPIFCKNDILLLANRFPVNGEYGAFYQGEKLFIRQYLEEEGQYRLKCLHNKGEDLVFKRLDCIEYLGACIDVIRA
jgi:transcriptional regulator with XRE-family HTH domain